MHQAARARYDTDTGRHQHRLTENTNPLASFLFRFPLHKVRDAPNGATSARARGTTPVPADTDTKNTNRP
ncbi:hypothetical protein B0H17DRAFT_1078018 [Mycena rosella]|uniref:Uncharacterized protein n=1 Tax=Mycena rosella TaxID=1033263 RepID=A0AAD7D856_MYCRO|nr:hypothetical protein B0H17DRAFT_1078018 [Mycena rosella]